MVDGGWVVDDNLISDIEHYLNTSKNNLAQLEKDVQLLFKATIDETGDLLSQLLFWGIIISIISVLFITVTTLMISISTRRSMSLIVERTKDLALGGTDFSKRLVHNKKDEVGYLVYWFNKLSDKLEEDYIRLKEISITDKLTQLNNRTRTDQFLPEALERVTSEKTPLVLAIIDIDNFKHINDNFGHLAGDVVLQVLAETLKKNATSNDYISRWGGE